MSKLERKESRTLVPELPKDIPMPKYRYQDDRGPGKDRKGSESDQRAAKILADAHIVCCAARQLPM